MANPKNSKQGNKLSRSAARQKIVWGWLRVALGIGQMTLAIAMGGLLLLMGFHYITWIFFAITMILMITSRLLYHGRKGPNKFSEAP